MTIPTEEEFTPKYKFMEKRVFSGHDKRIDIGDLSEDQHHVLDALSFAADELSPGEYTSLGGYAGTGKSTLIPLLAENLGSLGTTAFCCFTGKAANVLKRKLEVAGIHEADTGYIGTIHGLMYAPIVDKNGIVTGWARRDQLINFGDIKRVIIDEASMVNEKILSDLLAYNVSVILVGDHGQLRPIEGDSIISKPEFRLEKIHRQAESNPIIQLSQAIRLEGNIPRNWKESEHIRFISQGQMGKIAAQGFSEFGLDMGLLVRSNAKRNMFNAKAAGGNIPRVGDILICLRNNPPIFNGMRGYCKAITPKYDHWFDVTIDFPDDGLELTTLINRHQFNKPKTLSVYDLYGEYYYPRIKYPGLMFDFGMALTVHKAQGSAFEQAIIFPETWPRDSEDDGYQRWLYTGVTRAADILYIVK